MVYVDVQAIFHKFDLPTLHSLKNRNDADEEAVRVDKGNVACIKCDISITM